MKPKVLVIEDDSEMATMLKVTLSARFDVEICTEKAHAINRAKAYMIEHGEPDAVIIDLIINGEGGLDFYQWLHNHDYYPPVIFLTGCHQQNPEFIAAQYTGEQVYEKDHFSSAKLAQFLSEMVADKAS